MRLLNPSYKLVLDLPTPEGWKAELTWATRQCTGRESNLRSFDHKSSALTTTLPSNLCSCLCRSLNNRLLLRTVPALCTCVSERQGSSLELQLEQTSSCQTGGTTSSSRERIAQTRQLRAKTHRRASPYYQQSRDSRPRSRDSTHLSLQHYTSSSSYDQRRYYYDQTYDNTAYNSTYMMDCEFTRDDRLVSTASSLAPYNYPLYEDDYVSTQRSPSAVDQSACAVQSSVIVRGHADHSETQSRWQTTNSCCKLATEQTGRQYGDDDDVGEDYVMVHGGVAVYTSVIVATPGPGTTH